MSLTLKQEPVPVEICTDFDAQFPVSILTFPIESLFCMVQMFKHATPELFLNQANICKIMI